MKRLAGILSITILLLAALPTLAGEAIVEVRPGNQKVNLYETPGGKRIATANSNVLLQRGVSQKVNGYVRVLGFGRTVWIREDVVFLGESAGFSSSTNQKFGAAGTQGVNWLD